MSSSHNILYSSANSSASTLRPRGARLISYVDDENASTENISGINPASNVTSRGTSPALESRVGSAPVAWNKVARSPQNSPHIENADRRPSNGLWDPWSQIQGIASTILGNDTSYAGKGKGPETNKKPTWMKQDRTYGSVRSAREWGPKSVSTANQVQATIEDRQAELQAKKREALLTLTPADRDVAGRFKRKGSDASISIRSAAIESSEEALVYKHLVQASDTMAGVTIKYSCQAEVFRKANRFWPNDNIQTRKYVLLPVDACTVRGRKVDTPDNLDLLSEDTQQTATLEGKPGASTNGSNSPFPMLSPISSARQILDDIDYRHDSWVQLPCFPTPTEIVRVPRRNIGYFPRARRKSNQNLVPLDSTASSPRTSFDTLRHPPSHAAQQAQLHYAQAYPTSASLSSSPVRRGKLSNPISRQRSSSTITTASTAVAGNTFASALRGPGGVGTLRGLRTEMSRPGPAEDPLNQRFAKYLPDVAPPVLAEEDDVYQPNPIRAFSSLNLSVPRASIDSVRSNRSASGGSSVGDWVKKLARPAASRKEGDRTISQNTLGVEPRLGDLIELETNLEELTDHGVEQGQGSLASGQGTYRSGQSDGEMRTSIPDEDLLDVRFPVRGRLTRAYVGD